MQRYDLDEHGGLPYPHGDGDWVKWEDAEVYARQAEERKAMFNDMQYLVKLLRSHGAIYDFDEMLKKYTEEDK